jgi:glycerol-1-phosphate dehydrogenase [NAD(P)+]
MPSELLLNYEILASAPERYVNASLLDSLSNRSATYDWRHFSHVFKPSNELSAILAEVSAKHVLGANEYSRLEKVRVAVDQQVMSGISMLLAGSSQPCSGSEHILCRIANLFTEFDSYLHGELVGALSLFSMYLQQKIALQDVEFVTSIFPQWHQIFEIIDEIVGAEEFFRNCHDIRPERQTILNQFTETELAAELRSFVKYAN